MGGHGTGTVPTAMTVGHQERRQTKGFLWEKVAQRWQGTVLFLAELPEVLCIGKTPSSHSIQTGN